MLLLPQGKLGRCLRVRVRAPSLVQTCCWRDKAPETLCVRRPDQFFIGKDMQSDIRQICGPRKMSSRRRSLSPVIS